MEIFFTPEMLAYTQKNNITELTVNDVTTKGSCCKITVSNVTLGSPTKKNRAYTLIEAYGVRIHLSTKLNYEDKVTFSYGKLLFKEMIECHGYEINRSASLF